MTKNDKAESFKHLKRFLSSEFKITSKMDRETHSAIRNILLTPEVNKAVCKLLDIPKTIRRYKSTGSKIVGGKDLTWDDQECAQLLIWLEQGLSKQEIYNLARESDEDGNETYFGEGLRTFQKTIARNEDNLRKTHNTINALRAISKPKK